MTQIGDPTGYRRGLVLGLTLAETLLLVLFLLLLSYAVLLGEQEEENKRQAIEIAELNAELSAGITKLMDTFTVAGVPIDDPNALVLRLQQLTSDVARNEQLKKDLEKFTRLVPTPEIAEELAARFEEQKLPKTPQEVLEAELGEGEDKPAAPGLPEPKPQTLGEAQTVIDRLQGQMEFYEKLQAELGNGLTYPPCWARNGKPVYIYDAALLDDGLRLTARDDRSGMDMSALTQNGPEPALGSVIRQSAFLARTNGMFEWSVGQKCRFYVRLSDETSVNNKLGYQQARRTVENHFYIFEGR